MSEQESVGTAVYMEVTKGNTVYQIFVTPQGAKTNGVMAPSMLLNRRLTASRSKTRWNIDAAQIVTMRDGDIDDPTNALEAADKTIAQHMSFFRQIATQNFKLRKQLIHIAVTASDLDEMAAGKTPYKILGRMERSRKQLNFPDNIVTGV